MPKMFPGIYADGSRANEFPPQFHCLFGAGTFDAGAENTRFEGFVTSQSRITRAFTWNREFMQSEFDAPPGLLHERAEAAGREGSVRFQHDITRLREAARFKSLDEDFAALPGNMRGSTLTNSADD